MFRIGIAALLFLMMNAQASPLVGSDHRLSFMKKLQGGWQRDCRKVVSAGKVVFEQTKLSVSFTDLTFTTTEYTNKECFTVHTVYKTKYRYTLGDLAPPIKGKKVYKLNLSLKGNAGFGGSSNTSASNSSPPGIIRLAEKNIVLFDDGYLYFGLKQPGEDPAKRLTQLDRQTPFYRR